MRLTACGSMSILGASLCKADAKQPHANMILFANCTSVFAFISVSSRWLVWVCDLLFYFYQFLLLIVVIVIETLLGANSQCMKYVWPGHVSRISVTFHRTLCSLGKSWAWQNRGFFVAVIHCVLYAVHLEETEGWVKLPALALKLMPSCAGGSLSISWISETDQLKQNETTCLFSLWASVASVSNTSLLGMFGDLLGWR